MDHDTSGSDNDEAYDWSARSEFWNAGAAGAGGYGVIPCHFDKLPGDVLRLLLLHCLNAMDRRLAWGVCTKWNNAILADVGPFCRLNRRQRDECELLRSHSLTPFKPGKGQSTTSQFRMYNARVLDRLASWSARVLIQQRDAAIKNMEAARANNQSLGNTIKALQQDLVQAKLPFSNLVAQLEDPARAGLLMETLQQRKAEREAATVAADRDDYERQYRVWLASRR